MMNILPERERKRVRLDYRMRFAAAASIAGACALCVGTALLSPALFRLEALRADLSLRGDLADAAIARPDLTHAAKTESAAGLLFRAVRTASIQPRPSLAFAAILEARSSAIAIRRMEYVSADGAAAIKFSGTAATRRDLALFKQALSTVPGVTDVAVPSDSLLAAADVPFLATVTYRPAAENAPVR